MRGSDRGEGLISASEMKLVDNPRETALFSSNNVVSCVKPLNDSKFCFSQGGPSLMKRILKGASFALVLSVLFVSGVRAQTINAASCNESDVQTALTSVSADGTTVVVPSGSCTWTTTLTYNQVYSTTIQGQTTCSGTPASSCTDNTIITDNYNRSSGGDNPDLLINTVAGKSFRLTGFTFTQTNGTTTALTYLGILRIYGNSQSVRLDHCHFNNVNQTNVTFDGVFGVADHILAYIPSEFMRNLNSSLFGVDTDGNNAFTQPTGFGTNQFFFLEDSTMTGPSSNQGNGTNDCFRGGKFVVRYNVLDYSSVQGHATGHAGDDRGCRAAELYNNTFTLSNDTGNYWQFNAFFLSGGTALIWGNTFPSSTNYYSHVVTAHINREDNATYTQTPPPAGWGYCGTGLNGTGSAWDQSATSSTGYACMDQVGRGMGDMITGTFPTKCNSTLGCSTYNGQWTREAVDPVYEWNDTWTCTGSNNCTFWDSYDPGITANQDYFLGYGNTSCAATASGNCTAGVGVGTLANRPASCTANPVSYPAGNSPGVGYWATDQNTLYVCTATNTWKSYYTPYPYPHPLTQSTTPAPAPPTKVQAVSPP